MRSQSLSHLFADCHRNILLQNAMVNLLANMLLHSAIVTFVCSPPLQHLWQSTIVTTQVQFTIWTISSCLLIVRHCNLSWQLAIVTFAWGRLLISAIVHLLALRHCDIFSSLVFSAFAGRHAGTVSHCHICSQSVIVTYPSSLQLLHFS